MCGCNGSKTTESRQAAAAEAQRRAEAAREGRTTATQDSQANAMANASS